jgi:hypothetical protein
MAMRNPSPDLKRSPDPCAREVGGAVLEIIPHFPRSFLIFAKTSQGLIRYQQDGTGRRDFSVSPVNPPDKFTMAKERAIRYFEISNRSCSSS